MVCGCGWLDARGWSTRRASSWPYGWHGPRMYQFNMSSRGSGPRPGATAADHRPSLAGSNGITPLFDGTERMSYSASGPPTGWPIIRMKHTDDAWLATRLSVAGRVGHADHHQAMSLWHARSTRAVRRGGPQHDNEHCCWSKGTTAAPRSSTDCRSSFDRVHYSASVVPNG